MLSAILISAPDSLVSVQAHVPKTSSAELIKSGRYEELFDQFLTGSIDLMAADCLPHLLCGKMDH